jgi:hypothetical protein
LAAANRAGDFLGKTFLGVGFFATATLLLFATATLLLLAGAAVTFFFKTTFLVVRLLNFLAAFV